MKQKARTSSERIKDNELTNYAQHIVSNMTTNPIYPDPKPTLGVIQNLITLYSAALLKTVDGNKVDTANKNAARVDLTDALSSLANYVNLTAENDLVKLQSSGLDLTSLPTPVGILDAPTLKMHFGNNAGEAGYEISSDPKATEYIILYTTLPVPENDADWHSKVVSGTKGVLTNLVHKKEHIFKAAATSPEANKLNLYNFSDPIEQYVP